MAGAYKLGLIKETTDAAFGGRPRYGFDVIGEIGKPLVHLAFETREQAETARTT
jgi:hypothetical protein